MIYAGVFLVSAVGAFIQAVTGFGAAIFMMLFFSLWMPITTATAVNGALCLVSNITNSWTHRKHIRWRLIPLPAVTFLIVSYFAIRLAKSMDTALLKRVFGAVLILLSVYFLFIAKKLRVKATPASSALCGGISGVTGGMFGASGPPMVVYFLAALDSKEAYLGTMQMFSLVTGLWSLGVRLTTGFYTVKMLPMIALGAVGAVIGQVIGVRVVHKISPDTLRTAVYIMLAVSGIINML